MSDPVSAALAADELAAALDDDANDPAALRGFPQARVVVGEAQLATVQAFVPQGRLLVYQRITGPDVATARADAETLLAAQLELSADFEPTPQADVPGLDTDPFELERLALNPPGVLDTVSGSYSLDEYLRVALSPDTEQAALSANGFVGAYLKQSYDDATGYTFQVSLYELGTLPQADYVYQVFRRIEEQEFTDRTRFDVPEDPTIPCYRFRPEPDGPYYQRCYVRENQYLASVDVFGVTNLSDDTLIRQLLADQIALIRNS